MPVNRHVYPYGIANNNTVKTDSVDVADNDYAKFTANGLEGRSYAEVLSDLGLVAWASWTPTLTGITIGSGTVVARKMTFGNICDFELIITLAADSAITGDFNFTLPHNYVNKESFHSFIYDANTTIRYICLAFHSSPNKVVLRPLTIVTYVIASATFSSTVPITWAVGDEIHVRGSYEI